MCKVLWQLQDGSLAMLHRATLHAHPSSEQQAAEAALSDGEPRKPAHVVSVKGR